MILSGLVVAEEREDQAAPAGGISIARECSDMRDRSGFGVDPSGNQGIFHALVQGAIDPSDWQRPVIGRKPGLLPGKLQESNERARGNQIVAGETGPVRLN